MISHDLKAALDTAENIVMLYKGRVQLEGSPEDFRKTKIRLSDSSFPEKLKDL